jgi:hypothetical protein
MILKYNFIDIKKKHCKRIKRYGKKEEKRKKKEKLFSSLTLVRVKK